jgi:hypothetical protein
MKKQKAKKGDGSVKVESYDHLLSLLVDGGRHDFCIILMGGGAFSRKEIMLYDKDKLDVFNSIDGTFQTLSRKSVYSKSNIGEAIDKGAFFRMPGQ